MVDQETLSVGCSGCLSTPELQFDFTMAFQPIVNLGNGTIFAQEALVRGLNNESAASILSQVTDQSRYRFDQACRVRAIQLAAELGIQSMVSINFLPNAVYQPDLCIRTTIETAKQCNFPLNKILFELTEVEKVKDYAHVRAIIEHYQKLGFKTALDDFGAGYSGLNFLADFQPDFIKLDMALIRNIDQDKGRQAIVRGIIQVCRELAIEPIAEGIETEAELAVLKQMDIQLFQGYYFAKPSFRSITTHLNLSPG
ncbi:EAL domain-containing protein [Acaryochloris marina]|uniref:EAL domain protein n=2 Tax=Acaryochloris marina TaxID=155978 RepID=B0CEI5_ACAM1|nr:EAL domain protein [Acaryochloris marina MBIC11017]BDM81718.1 diguanylate phosphodiesterase [Acaryochloris marina MBIC10699]